MPRMAAAALVLALCCAPTLAADKPDQAWVENGSASTQCAEQENVAYTLANPKVGRFVLEVSAPVYLPDLKADSIEPDFANCEVGKEEVATRFAPTRVTLFEDEEIRVVGDTLEQASRAKGAAVIVGASRASDLHRVRWFQKVEGEFYEFIVIDPLEGSWRVRPIPTEAFPNAAYGTSFLVGPVGRERRPRVDIGRLKIDPRARAFRMTFAKGGVGEIRIRSADRERIVLDVAVDGLPAEDPPAAFAAVRSMFVSPTNADTARVNWKTDAGLFNEPVMEFKGANVREVRFDRIEISKHNTSAPDLTYRGFGPPAPAAKGAN